MESTKNQHNIYNRPQIHRRPEDLHTYRKRRSAAAFLFLGAGTLLFFVLNVCMGSVDISLWEIKKSITGQPISQTVQRILWDIRLPRTFAALILGGGLALAGYLLQTFFHNPIAGPFVLGISSGAKMVVALVMVLFMGRGIAIHSTTLIGAAFFGAMISMGIVLALSTKVRGMSMLVVSGVMIGYICSAVTELVITFADDAEIVNLHNWSRGSFSGMAWDNVVLMSVVVTAAFVAVFLLSKPLSAYQLGESYAKNMGVHVFRLQIFLVVLSSILSACVVAFAGPVSFVGIAVPHLVKLLLGSTKPILMIPACFLGGSIFCLFCDLLSRNLFSPTEISISTMTAVFGAPIVLWVMAGRRKEMLA